MILRLPFCEIFTCTGRGFWWCCCARIQLRVTNWIAVVATHHIHFLLEPIKDPKCAVMGPFQDKSAGGYPGWCKDHPSHNKEALYFPTLTGLHHSISNRGGRLWYKHTQNILIFLSDFEILKAYNTFWANLIGKEFSVSMDCHHWRIQVIEND